MGLAFVRLGFPFWAEGMVAEDVQGTVGTSAILDNGFKGTLR